MEPAQGNDLYAIKKSKDEPEKDFSLDIGLGSGKAVVTKSAPPVNDKERWKMLKKSQQKLGKEASM